MQDLWGSNWNARGELTARRYHDGQLLGVTLVGPREVVLLLREPEGSSFQLVLSEVSGLSVDDFRQGNIISDVWYLPRRLWEPALGKEVRTKFGVNVDGPLAAVICSYGALVLALCGSVEVRGGTAS